MLHAPLYTFDTITVRDTVARLRNASGWLAPARVTKVAPYNCEVVHNGRFITSGINRTRGVKADGYIYDAELGIGLSTLLPKHDEPSDNGLSREL